MKLTLVLLPLALAAPFAFAQQSGIQAPAQGGQSALKRKLPQAFRVQVNPGQEEAFDAEHWLILLEERDLDLREESFDRLLRVARGSSEARKFLEELAESEERELAWTARMALRELKNTRKSPAFAFLGDPKSGGQQLRLHGLDLGDPLGLELFFEGLPEMPELPERLVEMGYEPDAAWVRDYA